MPDGSRDESQGGNKAAWIVSLLTLVAACLHVAVQSQRPPWHDEACTYWTTRIPALDILRGIRTDGSPPLYFLFVQAVTRLFGSSGLSLRLVSIAAATALVPACYALARRVTTRRAALMAAALVAVSPLVHYYAVEARGYALLQLESSIILLTALRAAEAPESVAVWIALVLAETLQLWTHGHAVFVVAAIPLVCAFARRGRRGATLLRAAAASAVAYLLAFHALALAWQQSSSGVADWLGPIWEQTPPAAAIARSLEAFGFGALPAYLGSLGPLPSVRWLAILLTALLVAAASAPARHPRPSAPTVTVLPVLTFVLLPLVGAWLYSMLRQPIYLVGRYDTIVLPAFLVVMAIGLDRLTRRVWWLGAACGTGILGLSLAVYLAAAGNTVFPNEQDRLAARFIAERAAPSDLVLTTGLRRAVVAYNFDRAAFAPEVLSYPSEMAEHPGWYSEKRLLESPEALAREAEHVVKSVQRWAEQPGRQRIWLLRSGVNPVDEVLYRELRPLVETAGENCSVPLNVICLTLVARP